MRKRNVKFCLDKLLWFGLMILPLVFCLVLNFNTMSDVSMIDVFTSDYGFSMSSDNIFVSTLNQVFGEGGTLPLWSIDSFIPYYISYLAVIVLVQVLYDVLIFIPKLCHKYMHILTQDEE